ncbi:MerR family DNA-binding transcriptional regulator [Cupriavidus sp. CuC1]|uniref:MerR family DNA-binding transcriptional regulator n=1 Tax=Cupriavidus sp. CuC1 TaxID=3373131 RepID=UPI0037D4A611
MERFVSIGEAAGALGVSVATLRRWEANGKLIAAYTAGGHRRYDLAKLRPCARFYGAKHRGICSCIEPRSEGRP